MNGNPAVTNLACVPRGHKGSENEGGGADLTLSLLICKN